MPYQVLARKYRPQRFDDIVGQQAATRTLRNALAQRRLAQAFVFAGPRGVGKTTTARILARALNCAAGPTPDPCGTCDACVEIAEGRDIDVLEIDAATHTQVENIREVIIAGLAMAPVRNRYKVYIIDEVHQLSSHSFNALLKSIEEPPPHVMFMMATTQIEKIPETILSRSQVYELRTIGRQQIADQLRMIADAESIAVEDAALGLVARAADGSMRDAQSAFDQVIAFAGEQIGVDDVSTVLGLIGREPVLDAVAAVADEDAAAVFDLVGRFVEAGYDLRLVCRELSRAIRDLLVLSIDSSRAADPEIAGEGERDRLVQLAQRFSREDLMRAFDAIARAEAEIRSAAQPRYHLEMALLRWMHLRKLVPLADLLQGRGSPARTMGGAVSPPRGSPREPAPRPTPSPSGERERGAAPRPTPSPSGERERGAAPRPTPSPSRDPQATAGQSGSIPAPSNAPAPGVKEALLKEIKQSNKVFHGMVVAPARRIDLEGDRLIFTFPADRRTAATQLKKKREWVEALASQIVGRRLTVEAVQAQEGQKLPREAPGAGESEAGAAAAEPGDGDGPAGDGAADGLRARALGDPLVKAIQELFPAEITDIESM